MKVEQLKNLIETRRDVSKSEFNCLKCLSKLFVECNVDPDDYEPEFLETVLKRAMAEVDAKSDTIDPEKELQLSIIKNEFADMHKKWQTDKEKGLL